ncbi:unnamed protein product, partial [Meganyctiphanes norvegica]
MGRKSLMVTSIYQLVSIGQKIAPHRQYHILLRCFVVTQLDRWPALKDLALSPDAPQDEDELTVLAGWLEKTCPNVTQDHIQALTRTERVSTEDHIQALTRTGVQNTTVAMVESACPHLHEVETEEEFVFPWTFIDSLYFSMTVATTIGYGHISPSQTWGRFMCMIYAILTIPLTGILLAWSSEFFGEKLFELFTSKVDEEKQQNKRFIILATVLYIIFGFVVFIFIPSLIFTYIEPWSYFEGVYYSFITLTTIGFGDFVTGCKKASGCKNAFLLYMLLWI